MEIFHRLLWRVLHPSDSLSLPQNQRARLCLRQCSCKTHFSNRHLFLSSIEDTLTMYFSFSIALVLGHRRVGDSSNCSMLFRFALGDLHIAIRPCWVSWAGDDRHMFLPTITTTASGVMQRHNFNICPDNTFAFEHLAELENKTRLKQSGLGKLC